MGPDVGIEFLPGVGMESKMGSSLSTRIEQRKKEDWEGDKRRKSQRKTQSQAWELM